MLKKINKDRKKQKGIMYSEYNQSSKQNGSSRLMQGIVHMGYFS